MSFQIFWDKLDDEVEERIRCLLASHFAAAKRPAFLGEVHLDELRFGAVPPEAEVLDVTDPFPEFYLAREPAGEHERCGEEEEEEEEDTAKADAPRGLPRHTTGQQGHPELCPTCRCQMDRGGGQHHGVGPAAEGYSEGADGLPRTTQHRGPRLGSTEDAGPHGWRPHCRGQLAPARRRFFHVASRNGHAAAGDASPVEAMSAGSSFRGAYRHSDADPCRHRPQSPTPSPTGSPPGARGVSAKFAAFSENDAQVLVKFTYDGDLRLSLRTELKVDYLGMPNFVVLPVRLTVTRAQIDGTAVICHAGGRAIFCFLPPEDDHGSVIKDVHIQSELGDEAKAVLKNVDKIEKFIVDQLRKVINDNLVFPSFYSTTVNN